MVLRDNISVDRPHFVTHLECSMTGERYEAGQVHNLSRVGRPLLVRYDLAKLAKAVSKDELASRPMDFWRYREFLPVKHARNIVSLGEMVTPIVDCPTLHRRLAGGTSGAAGSGALLIKDESRLPTGSFKARGLCMAVSMARELGLTRLAMPTNGNAGAAMAAYASRAGMRTFIFCPHDTPQVNIREIALQGAHVYSVNGLINDCGKIVAEGKAAMGWFDVSTLKEPYRIEGKKTMGLEVAEQFGWDVPDVIFYPTGGGTGLIGMCKAFDELEAIGWIGSKRPRMVAVQAAGCAPIVRAWEQGKEHAELWKDARTIAWGIRVPAAVGDFLMIRGMRATNGFGTTVTDQEILAARAEMAGVEGFLMCPEGAATYAAYKKELAGGRVSKTETALLFNCASGLKYELPPATRTIDRTKPVDYEAMMA